MTGEPLGVRVSILRSVTGVLVWALLLRRSMLSLLHEVFQVFRRFNDQTEIKIHRRLAAELNAIATLWRSPFCLMNSSALSMSSLKWACRHWRAVCRLSWISFWRLCRWTSWLIPYWQFRGCTRTLCNYLNAPAQPTCPWSDWSLLNCVSSLF